MIKKLLFLAAISLSLCGFINSKLSNQKGSPLINPPFVTGNYPNTPFLFAIPTQGVRPITWTAEGLPQGLKLDSSTGIITGNVEVKGESRVKITAKNKQGISSSTLIIKIGDLLALTPPMGWNSWNTFAENISDSLVRQIADSMVSTGMRDIGYQYINIDDYWQLVERDSKGNIQINKQKFPHGIKAVADFVHSKGLKIGVYSDAAELTCGGVAGSYGHEEQDAMNFEEWGIDLLKYDYCNAPSARDTAIMRYKRMANALHKIKRSIVFSVCEWGEGGIYTSKGEGNRKPYEWAANLGGNYWRTTLDIRNTWKMNVYNERSNSIMQILDINAPLDKYASPGHWNDPDMMVVGINNMLTTVVNRSGAVGCTEEEYRSHMSLWCLMASPLLCGNDIRNMSKATKNILLNSEIIAINQDILGKQAKRIRDNGDEEVFAKPLADGSWAIGLLNRNDSASASIRIAWDEIGLQGICRVRNVWKHQNIGEYKDYCEISVLPHQCIVIRVKSNKI
jgi:alpha-galactosidase